MKRFSNLKKISLLYVEDDKETLKLFSKILKPLTKQLWTSSSIEESYKKYQINQPDLIITDLKLKNENALDFIKKVRKENKDIPIIILTGHQKTEYITEALKLGVNDVFFKPIEDPKKCLIKLNKEAKYILIEKENTKRNKVIETLMNELFDISFIVEENNIIKMNKKTKDIITYNNINKFLEKTTPPIKIKEIENSIIKYEEHFYKLKIKKYCLNDFIFLMNKLS